MQSKILYFGFYCNQENIEKEQRYNSPASNLKMNYIADCINKLNFDVTFVSACETLGEKTFDRKIEKISNNKILVLFKTLGRKNIFYLIIRKILIKMQLFIYLFKNIKKDEIVIAYHSMKTARILLFLKRIKKFYLIYEVEELYKDVDIFMSSTMKMLENKIINSADAYIFPTEDLASILHKGKPYVTICGTYRFEKRNIEKENDKINIVYAGTLDVRKGCLNVINSAEYLNDKYCIHVLGGGEKSEIEYVKNYIKENAYSNVVYEGLLNGENYIEFLQKCDIGLSVQKIDASFNSTSFPSKILSYLSNGLAVISTRIQAVEKSPVSHLINFCNSDNPRDIAKAIVDIDLDRQIFIETEFNQLEKQFLEKLNSIFVSFYNN